MNPDTVCHEFQILAIVDNNRNEEYHMYMKIFGKRRQEIDELSLDHNTRADFGALSEVMRFRERFDTDSEFRATFAAAIKEAVIRSEVTCLDESMKNAEAYGDRASQLGSDTPEIVHQKRADLFSEVLDLILQFSQTEHPEGYVPMTSEDFADNLRFKIGQAVGSAYWQGTMDAPLWLRDPGVLGSKYQEYGMVVAVDRLKEQGITRISDVEV